MKRRTPRRSSTAEIKDNANKYYGAVEKNPGNVKELFKRAHYPKVGGDNYENIK